MFTVERKAERFILCPFERAWRPEDASVPGQSFEAATQRLLSARYRFIGCAPHAILFCDRTHSITGHIQASTWIPPLVVIKWGCFSLRVRHLFNWKVADFTPSVRTTAQFCASEIQLIQILPRVCRVSHGAVAAYFKQPKKKKMKVSIHCCRQGAL